MRGPTRAQKVRLGAFVVVGLALMVGFVVLLTGIGTMGAEKTYDVRFAGSVSGLTTRSSVRINGVKVGQVKAIELDPKNIEETKVIIGVSPTIPIKMDAKAYLMSRGITGGKYIAIRGGTNEADERPTGTTIPSGTTFLSQLMSGEGPAGQLMDNLTEISGILKGDVQDDTGAPPGMLGDLALLMRELTATSAELRHALQENRGSFKTAADNVAVASNNLDGALSSGSDEFNKTMTSARRTLDTTTRAIEKSKIDETLRELDQTLEAARQRIENADVDGAITDLRLSLTHLVELIATVNNLLSSSSEDVRVILTNLRDTSENLAIFSRTIRDDPSALLVGTNVEPR